jgi:hypothetical protein
MDPRDQAEPYLDAVSISACLFSASLLLFRVSRRPLFVLMRRLMIGAKRLRWLATGPFLHLLRTFRPPWQQKWHIR